MAQVRKPPVPLAGSKSFRQAIAVAGEHKRDVERFCVIQRLLHAGAEAVIFILGFDQGDWLIGAEIKDVIGAFAFAATVQLAANDDSPFGETDFFTNLSMQIPSGRH
jgi:hypothetical protein